MGEADPLPEAFFSPEPRLALMDELGLDRALMWPTLASLLEERLRRRSHRHAHRRARPQPVDARALDLQLRGPDLRHPGHQRCPSSTRRSEELEWVVERGAKIVLIRPGAGSRLPGLPVVRPARVRPLLAAKVTELDITGGHARLRRRAHQRYYNQWEGNFGGEHLPVRRVVGLHGPRAHCRAAASSTRWRP
jgi:hypothetical protein